MMTEEQFSEAYNTYHKLIVRICSKIVGYDNAEDIAHDAFTAVWSRRDEFRNGCSIKTWVAVIARNMSIDFLRVKRNQPHDDVTAFDIHANGLHPVRRLQLQQAVIVFKELSNREKAMFGLMHFHGEKGGRIAQIFGIHQSNVTRCIDGAREKMMRVL